MCGRFAVKKAVEDMAKFYAAQRGTAAGFPGSYNLCPTELAPIVMEDDKQERTIELARFGITTQIQGRSFPLMNVQSEKAANREDFKKRRCVIPADGFFEWEKVSPKEKQPYFFSPQSGFFSFAGLWKQDARGLAFTILTTRANDVVGQIHPRMPVILTHNAVGEWLAPDAPKESLISLMEPFPDGLMQSWKVSKAVNSPRNKEAVCINSL